MLAIFCRSLANSFWSIQLRMFQKVLQLEVRKLLCMVSWQGTSVHTEATEMIQRPLDDLFVC